MIRKAVFPVAGLGTRMLPATKALPKEMLPVVDRPLIQYAFEEARAAGIEQFIFVTGRGKSILEDHFDRAYELEDVLARKRKTAELEAVSGWMPGPGELSFNAINDKDFPMLQGTFLVFSVGVIFANLLADVLYFYLDPRVQSR